MTVNGLSTLISQLPLILMTINNGVNVTTLLPILIIPVIIYLFQHLPLLIKYIYSTKIPRSYVKYYLEEGRDNYNGFDSCAVYFMDNLSVFLNDFNSDSIKSGLVKKYQRSDDNPNLLYKCVNAIISPDCNYFCKFILDKKIIDEINNTGYVFTSNINLQNLLINPIYISFEKFKKTEKIDSRKSDDEHREIEKERVKISAHNIKAAIDFIYIVNNYYSHKQNNIINFKLKKYLYLPCEKHNFFPIMSYVNVIKNYQNVFLSKDNYHAVVDIIREWDKNKISQLKQGIPNKLAFFFTGSPGCGKTSLVYAIANETKKNIVSVNLHDFTNKNFLSAMTTIENNVVLFDDIDSCKFLHRRDDKVKENNVDQMEILKMVMLSEDDKKDFNNKFGKEITLDVFLEVLDGYNYLNNCIVIFTSNHPELLDPAVIRPGRMDHTIDFGLCDEYQFKNIFKYFTKKNYREIDNQYIFRENHYSTSYLINTIILPNKSNPRKILQMLN